jgi:hypothetical protein
METKELMSPSFKVKSMEIKVELGAFDDEVYACYINIYGGEILFISEDKTTKKYKHY